MHIEQQFIFVAHSTQWATKIYEGHYTYRATNYFAANYRYWATKKIKACNAYWTTIYFVAHSTQWSTQIYKTHYTYRVAKYYTCRAMNYFATDDSCWATKKINSFNAFWATNYFVAHSKQQWLHKQENRRLKKGDVEGVTTFVTIFFVALRARATINRNGLRFWLSP